MRPNSSSIIFGIALSLAHAAAALEASTEASGGPALPVIVIEAPSVKSFNAFDESRDEFLLPKTGATTYTLDHAAIQSLPQGTDTPVDKLVLQTPGVSYDSAVSNPSFHIRNEYANAQTRINGILLPEGASGLGPVLETGFIGKFDLLTGALPAQYGLRTAGVLDLTTRSDFAPGGSASLYGGSLGTFSPSFDYSGTNGRTQYFVTGRYMQNNEGLENTTASVTPIHDKTQQGKFFGYVSTLLGDSSRLSFMSGASLSRFQIPNNPGQTPAGDFGPAVFDSNALNENERDTFLFNILALQTKGADFDTQVSVFSRYTQIHFIPDTFGDLVFNDVASDVTRDSVLNGIEFDGSDRLNDAHTLRAGFDLTAEHTQVNNTSIVLPGSVGAAVPTPESLTDSNSKVGWNVGTYVQDEWKLTEKLTLNMGARFDALYQFVDANQISPRVALVDKPLENTTLHVGFARYFTPPMQAQATPSNLATFNNTTQQPTIAANNPVLPERASYFDAGIDQTVLPGFTVGADAYYKLATDALDDGQFGQAVVLTQFNYAKEYSEGIELKAKYQRRGFTSYANFSANQTMAKDINSNQYLIGDPVEFAYIASHYHYTDDAQIFTASVGASYHWKKTHVSVDDIYGSGLRTGFANIQHVAPYNVVNMGLSHDFNPWRNGKYLTARVDVVNAFDAAYVLRNGTGIGEFAPQYGARRGFFMSLSQKF